MKKNYLYLLICLLCLIPSGILSAAADSVTVAINPDSKPFKYFDEEGGIAGIDAEVMRAIAEAEGIEIEFAAMTLEEIFEAVSSCKIDAAISALSWTEERAQLVSFSEPYAVGPQSVYIKVARDRDITGAETLSGLTVGVKRETTAEEHASALAEQYGFEVRTFGDYEMLFDALGKDEIDAAVSDEFLAKQFADALGDIKVCGPAISREPYAIAVCPEDPDLLEKINSGLGKIKSNGVLDQIILENLQ